MPVDVTGSEVNFEYCNILLDQIPISLNQIVKETRRDPILSKIHLFIREGWPKEVEDQFKAFQGKCSEISIENKMLMWGYRVIILNKLQK